MNHALVVDDSRTARAVLKQMLGKESCKADAVASAEAAIDYLQTQKPNVIFMDHMMPGMDGFAAVRMIKSDPTTEHIPIVMYTSRDGEMYVGQAQALGAADILCKPATQDDLRATLQRLSAAAAARPKVSAQRSAAQVPLQVASNEPINQPPVVEALVYENYESPAEERSSHSLLDEMPPPDLPNAGFTAPKIKSPSMSLLGPLLLIGCVVGLLIWGSFKYFSMQERESALLMRQQQLLQSLQWSINQAGEYAYNERPMAGKRLELLRELVNSAQLTGFKGSIVIDSHVGQYCLVQAGKKGFVMPNGMLSIGDCAVIGDNQAAALQRSGEQSAAFKDFLQQAPELTAGDISIEVAPKGASQPRVEYPAESAVKTAGDWNRIADMNNRVEMYLLED